MMRVKWFFQGEDFEHDSEVESGSDFLTALKLVNVVSYDGQEYRIIDTEIVIDNEPYIAILVEA